MGRRPLAVPILVAWFTMCAGLDPARPLKASDASSASSASKTSAESLSNRPTAFNPDLMDPPSEDSLVLANGGRLKERKTLAVDYRARHCSDTICNVTCEQSGDVCPFNVVGLESYPIEYQESFEGSKAEMPDIIQTIASTVGAPGIGMMFNNNMSAYVLSPSNPQGEIAFWTSLEDRYQKDVNISEANSKTSTGNGLSFPSSQLAFSLDPEDEKKYMHGHAIQFEKLIEYDDADLDGKYDPAGNDTSIQTVSLTDIQWHNPTSASGDFESDEWTGLPYKNQTKDARGVIRSHVQLASAKTMKNSMDPFSSNVPDRMITIDLETANKPFRPQSKLSRVAGEGDVDSNARIVTPNATRVSIQIRNFPFIGKKSRLALVAVMGSSGTQKTQSPDDDAFIRTSRKGFENIYIAGRASHRYKGYVTWTPNALVDGKDVTRVHARPLTRTNTGEASYSVFLGTYFYGCTKDTPEGLDKRTVTFSLGDAKSAFNPKSIEWDLVMGVGFSPLESVFALWWLVVLGTVIGSLLIVCVCSGGMFYYDGFNWQHPDDDVQCKSLLDENENSLFDASHAQHDDDSSEDSSGGPVV